MQTPERERSSFSPAPGDLLVCFAVRSEISKRFRALQIPFLVTGMGQKNAESNLVRRLESNLPIGVLSCGFAGALNPQLKSGDILFSHDPEMAIEEALLSLGARPGRFRLSPGVIVKAEEKALLYTLTGADAVDMESIAIREICRKRGIPSATVRVILDQADEDLPVDFNALMTREMNLSYPRLFWHIMRRPSLIQGLRKLQHDSLKAADRLGQVLAELLENRAAKAD